MNEQQTTPESEQVLAAVRETEHATLLRPAEPKPAPGDRIGVPGGLPPTRTARPRQPDSMLAVGPVPPQAQTPIWRRMTRTSVVWLITVPGAIACLMAACFELCTTPREALEVIAAFSIVLVLCLAWIVLMRLLSGRRSAPLPILGEPRINELFPQGALSRGASGTVVLPYEDTILYEETEDRLILFGRGGVIVWSADDLTPSDAAALQLYLRAQVPAGTLHVRGAFRARAAAPMPLPTLPKRGACHATAAAESRPRKLAALRLGQTLMRYTPLMWLLAIGAGVLIHELVVFSAPVLNSPWVWFVGLSAVQAAVLFCLLWWEAAEQKKQPYTTPEFSFCEDGLWMSAGRGEVRLPRGSVPAVRLRKALELRLPGGAVRLPYDAMSDQELIFRYFDQP